MKYLLQILALCQLLTSTFAYDPGFYGNLRSKFFMDILLREDSKGEIYAGRREIWEARNAGKTILPQPTTVRLFSIYKYESTTDFY